MKATVFASRCMWTNQDITQGIQQRRWRKWKQVEMKYMRSTVQSNLWLCCHSSCSISTTYPAPSWAWSSSFYLPPTSKHPLLISEPSALCPTTAQHNLTGAVWGQARMQCRQDTASLSADATYSLGAQTSLMVPLGHPLPTDDVVWIAQWDLQTSQPNSDWRVHIHVMNTNR